MGYTLQVQINQSTFVNIHQPNQRFFVRVFSLFVNLFGCKLMLMLVLKEVSLIIACKCMYPRDTFGTLPVNIDRYMDTDIYIQDCLMHLTYHLDLNKIQMLI